MTQQRFGMAVCLVVALLAFPRAGSAGMGEVILGMSGPQLIGYPLIQCRVVLDSTARSCEVSGRTFAGRWAQSKIRLTLEGGPYFSTGKDAEGQDYQFFKIGMLAFDPMLEIESWRSTSENRFAVYHGVLGVSYNLLFGSGFDSFTNVALKVRPIGVMFPAGKRFRVEVEYNLRLYPNAFSADEFGKVPLVPASTTGEAVHSFSFSVRKIG